MTLMDIEPTGTRVIAKGIHLSPRVLVVEDQTLIAMDLQALLEDDRAFVVVGPATSVSEADALLAKEQVDLALVDFMLSDGEAGPLLDHLRAKSIPFALCTGADCHELSSAYPFTPILAKPYKIEDVVKVMKGLVRR
jgi:CheY-like chemotaxis protein